MEQVTSSTEGEGIENSKHTQELPKLNQSHNEEVEMVIMLIDISVTDCFALPKYRII